MPLSMRILLILPTEFTLNQNQQPMEIELEIRVACDLTAEEEQELRDQAHAHDDPQAFLDSQEKWDYSLFTFDIASVGPYQRYDEEHTTIFLKDGPTFIARIAYETFQQIRTALLGHTPKTMADFKFPTKK